MRRKLTLCLVGLLLAASSAAAQTNGPGGHSPADGAANDAFPLGNRGPIIKPHEMKPITKEKFDKTVTAMFALADVNHTGMVTLAGFQAIIDARREAVIRNRFAEVDANHDGHIDIDEFIAWQKQLGSAAATACAGYLNQNSLIPETLKPPLGNDEQDVAMNVVLEPLSAMLITRANVHYRPGLTLDDLLAYENQRFDAIDTTHDGYLDQDEIATYYNAHYGHH